VTERVALLFSATPQPRAIAVKRTLLALTALAATFAGAPPAHADEFRVLFLGNSYTGVNDLPSLFAGLVNASGHTAVVDAHTPGGNTLGAPQANGVAHAGNPTSLGKIAVGGWDVVVLQEQSFLPTIPQALTAYMQPGALALDAAIGASSPDARTLLYMTWGRENGGGPFCSGSWCSPVFANFDAMQAALTSAYTSVAATLSAQTCPVGLAWQDWLSSGASAALFAADGSHPTLAGSYLAACCFFVSVTGESPIGNTFTGGLAPALALALQETAHSAVYGHGCGATPTNTSNAFTLELIAGGALGGLARFALDGPFVPGAGSPQGVFAIAARDAALPLPGGILGVDLAALVVGPLLSSNHVPGTGVLFGALVPDDAHLLGLTVHVQGAAVVGGTLVLSNALAWRLCP
jgi:hypothetical protein